MLGYIGAAVIEKACRRITLSGLAVGPDGLVNDPSFRTEAVRVLDDIVSAVS